MRTLIVLLTSDYFSSQVVRALNIVLLKLASEAPSGPVICSLVHVLLRCTGATDSAPVSGTSYGSAGGGLALVSLPVSEPLPPSSAKPASRLLLRVLAEESRRPEPFVFAGWRPPWPATLYIDPGSSNHPTPFSTQTTPTRARV